MNYLSLFSGIGGLDLGLDRAGMTCVGQVEIDEFCRRVLAKHWPEVPRHDDVRTAVKWWGRRPAPNLVAGGFPCQPVSEAGKGLAQADERWLWPEFAVILRALRPRYALMENVTGLLIRGFGDVLGDLAGLGYDARWTVVPACAFGAPHPRERVFVLAHNDQDHGRAPWPTLEEAASTGLLVDAGQSGGSSGRPTPWSVEPEVGRVVHGLPSGVDALRALGNAVVPHVGEFAGRLLMAMESVRLSEAS